MAKTLLTNAYVTTMDDAGTEYADGWVLVEDGFVEAVGDGGLPPADEVHNLLGALVLPGLINTHHHLCQTLTRTRAQETTLLEWFATLLPIWRELDDEAEYAGARTGIAELALSGCSTVFDHHYVFPRGGRGIVEAEIRAAQEIGVRIAAARGSMDMGESQGGFPPDDIVEDIDEVLAETERLAALSESGRGARVEIVVAPCTIVTSSERMMRESADLARRLGLKMHTHLAEVPDEEPFSLERYGKRPIDFFADTGWVGDDVWCAHCIHLSEGDIAHMAETGTGAAHCPMSNLRVAAGMAPVRAMLDAGVKVGLGVDGSASNERSDLILETKLALLVARARDGVTGLTAREALRLATRGSAACLGRDDLGSLEPGKCADIAVWRTDGLEFGGASDLVAALVLSGPHRVDRLYVGGETVVEDGRLVRADEVEIAREQRVQAQRFERLG
jgi:cytosine/adenosine deaminase-related metal-dependent hydrolase